MKPDLTLPQALARYGSLLDPFLEHLAGRLRGCPDSDFREDLIRDGLSDLLGYHHSLGWPTCIPANNPQRARNLITTWILQRTYGVMRKHGQDILARSFYPTHKVDPSHKCIPGPIQEDTLEAPEEVDLRWIGEFWIEVEQLLRLFHPLGGQRYARLLRIWAEGCPIKTIAQKEGMSPNRLASILQKARQTIRKARRLGLFDRQGVVCYSYLLTVVE